MQSYSQHGQDTFVYETFFKKQTEPGTFVDVGAYDGVTFSNTLLFERLGWTGVCVEPLPAPFRKLQTSRNAICVNCALADRMGEATFVEAEMPEPFEQMYSGLQANFDDRHTRLIREHGRNVRHYKVPVRTLPDILSEFGIRRFDYLSVDTEGSEWKILRDFDFGSYGVSVVSVENNARDDKLLRLMAQHGYQLIRTFAGFDELYAR